MKCQIINYQTGKTGWERGGGLRKFEKKRSGSGVGSQEIRKAGGVIFIAKMLTTKKGHLFA